MGEQRSEASEVEPWEHELPPLPWRVFRIVGRVVYVRKDRRLFTTREEERRVVAADAEHAIQKFGVLVRIGRVYGDDVSVARVFILQANASAFEVHGL